MTTNSRFARVLKSRDVMTLAFGAMIGWSWVLMTGYWVTTAGTLGTAAVGNTATATVAGKSSAIFAASIDPDSPLTLVGSGLVAASEAPLAGVYVHGDYAFVGGQSNG